MAIKYMVCSGKGGSGKSSVTAGICLALADMGKKVLCVDMDTGVKSLDLLLGAGEGVIFNWLDAINGSCSPENALSKTAYKNVMLLAPPVGNNINSSFDSFSELIKAYDNIFDYIFFDLPAGKSNFSDYTVRICDRAIIVANPDNITLRCSGLVAEKLCNTLTDIRLVVNKVDKDEMLYGNQVNLDDCVDLSSVRLIGVIPEDRSVLRMQCGSRLSSYISSAFLRTAKRISGENIPFNSKSL